MGAIGVFDSGLGGLTILKEFVSILPQYNYIYLGDNARAPYGQRSPEMIYQWTREAVDFLFKNGCELIILACFSASANALRRLQQEYLPQNFPNKKILGVLIPLAEEANKISPTGRVGILGTRATVNSGALAIELRKRRASLEIFSQAAPLLVPLIEEGWINRPETKRILRSYLRPLKQKKIDTLLLACTHYPLLYKQITAIMGIPVHTINPGKIVAKLLQNYLERHSEIEQQLTQEQKRHFLTTDRPETFSQLGQRFLGQTIKAEKTTF